MSQYTIPNVVDRSGGSEKIVDVYSHLLGNRIVYLGVPIDDGVANTIIARCSTSIRAAETCRSHVHQLRADP